jgi:response regulator RpfG family c-di-GMP phosphodiesterase
MAKNKPKILIVDDEKDMRLSMHAVLDKYFEVIDAADGKTALLVLKKNPIAVVISDIRMPIMSGIALLEKIKAVYPQSYNANGSERYTHFRESDEAWGV